MEDRHAQDMFHAILGDRGVVSVAGEDAKTFLQGLVTNDVSGLAPGAAAYAALLSAQGKILVDFLVTEAAAEKGGGLYLDCPLSLAGDLVKRLGVLQIARQDHHRRRLRSPRCRRRMGGGRRGLAAR